MSCTFIYSGVQFRCVDYWETIEFFKSMTSSPDKIIFEIDSLKDEIDATSICDYLIKSNRLKHTKLSVISAWIIPTFDRLSNYLMENNNISYT